MNQELYIFIARVMAVVCLSLGLGLLLNQAYYKRALPALLQNTHVLLLGGPIAILVGMGLVHYQTKWVQDWRMVVVVLGWSAIVKGVLLLVAPTFFKIFTPLATRPVLMASLLVLFGAGATYLGFFM